MPRRTLAALEEAAHAEALRADFPIDEPVYLQRRRRTRKRPILFAGSLDAPICVFGRDLGKDEVAEGGAARSAPAGRMVRRGFDCRLRRGRSHAKSDRPVGGRA